MNISRSSNVFFFFSDGSESKYHLLCPFEQKLPMKSHPCYLSWTAKGNMLIGNDKTDLRKNEIVNTLKSMDNYFGKHIFRTGNIPFTMFGPFDQKNNILFKDSTDSLKTKFEIFHGSKFDRNLETIYEHVLKNEKQCKSLAKSMSNSKVLLSFMIFSTVITNIL